MRRFSLGLWVLVGCSGSGADAPKQRPAHAEVAAPKPTDVQPEPTVRKPAAPDRFGASWRISNARFEDLVGDYRVEAPRGWTLRVGEDMPAFAPPWPGTVGFVANGTSIEAVMTRRAVPSQDDVVGLREELDAAGILVRNESKVRVNGHTRTAFVYLARDGREFQTAKWCDADICTRLEFAYPFGTPDASKTIRGADFVVEELSPAERDDLRTALVERGKARHESVDGLELDGLRLNDRGNGISFVLPDDGPWEIHLGDAARRRTNQRFILGRFAHVETGLVLKYAATPVAGLTSNEDYHHQLLAGLTQQFGASVKTPKPGATKLGSLPALQSEFDMGVLRGRLITATVDERVIQFTISQDVLSFDEQTELIDAVLEGVEGDGKPAPQPG